MTNFWTSLYNRYLARPVENDGLPVNTDTTSSVGQYHNWSDYTSESFMEFLLNHYRRKRHLIVHSTHKVNFIVEWKERENMGLIYYQDADPDVVSVLTPKSSMTLYNLSWCKLYRFTYVDKRSFFKDVKKMFTATEHLIQKMEIVSRPFNIVFERSSPPSLQRLCLYAIKTQKVDCNHVKKSTLKKLGVIESESCGKKKCF
ncbi:hypothetical protein CDAR_366261 [Caerostris darwini]|uniref:Uncharacterized protein n=1 Tax=Caerostris darwini TaxID=1538125 RepID=A0AAV4W782_9ARAC|nr:hypothetical protein CDAR_366261 [Caerostris darwini]